MWDSFREHWSHADTTGGAHSGATTPAVEGRRRPSGRTRREATIAFASASTHTAEAGFRPPPQRAGADIHSRS